MYIYTIVIVHKHNVKENSHHDREKDNAARPGWVVSSAVGTKLQRSRYNLRVERESKEVGDDTMGIPGYPLK